MTAKAGFGTDTTTTTENDAPIPCEANPEAHAKNGTGPADWLVEIACPGCTFTDVIVTCDGCLNGFRHLALGECLFCHYRGDPNGWIVTVQPIKEHRHG